MTNNTNTRRDAARIPQSRRRAEDSTTTIGSILTGNGGHVSISYSAAGASDSFFLASPFFPAPFFAAGFSSFPFFSSASGLSAPFLAGFGAILLTAGKKLSHYMYLAAKCS
eukprot:GHVU01232430.1.p1 GENE.GHVU01232430.1~~GHVU01232430.1.p1  ORF type:complete len:111 (-),score=1.46 GHVU01232430.1:826-1158(-)